MPSKRAAQPAIEALIVEGDEEVPVPVNTRGAILRQAPGSWEVVDLVVDDPQPGELQVKLAASGLCHSDDHIATGDMQVGKYPFLGGHEGAGVVAEGRPGRQGLRGGRPRRLLVPARLRPVPLLRQRPAVHLRLSAPTCYRLAVGRRDELPVKTADGEDVGQMCGLGTFAEITTVDVRSTVKIDKEHPAGRRLPRRLRCRHRLGHRPSRPARCGPGDTVIVMGVGGIGINAVQGAAHAGASHVIAVDPVPFKREKACELGATDDLREHRGGRRLRAAASPTARARTRRIVTVGVIKGEHIAQAFDAIRKGGRVVVTGLGDLTDVGIPINPSMLALFTKGIRARCSVTRTPARTC